MNGHCAGREPPHDHQNGYGRPRSRGPREAPALRLPTELLLRIFEFLPILFAHEIREDLVAWSVTSSCPNLMSLSLVCRGWRQAAQGVLYHSITLTRGDQVDGFLRTITDRPDLAERVTAAQLGLVEHSPEWAWPADKQAALSDAFLEVLGRLPNLRNLYLRALTQGKRRNFHDHLRRPPLKCLMLKFYDSHLNLAGETLHLSPADFYRAIALPTLDVFELNWRPVWNGPIDYELPHGLSPSLTRLSVTVNSPPGLIRILRLVAPCLRSFNLYTEHILDPGPTGDALAGLSLLRELRFDSQVSSTEGETNGWFCDILPALQKLERLSVSDQVAQPSILKGLPASLETLEYIYWDRRPDAILAVFEEILHESRQPLTLKEFLFAVDEEAYADAVDENLVQEVTDSFAKRGVKFSVTFELAEIPYIRWCPI
ncbi:hypothetical protein RHOSPDRAFT_33111 [Rhodotorula sp. JG-1b]|nr:hypothetical protein RHOSPDRAFT_33111 [Rhodotorula sp. JG-1b]